MSKASIVIAAATVAFVVFGLYPAIREVANVFHTVSASLQVAADKAAN